MEHVESSNKGIESFSLLFSSIEAVTVWFSTAGHVCSEKVCHVIFDGVELRQSIAICVDVSDSSVVGVTDVGHTCASENICLNNKNKINKLK